MKKIYILFIGILIQLTAIGQDTYWQQQVHYRIDVSLNDKEHTLDGFLKLQYTNNSPDTLTYIWFHLWPNAFKNDQTAFSEQSLQNGSTGFYFSGKEQRGYINRLDFRTDNTTLHVEDHPQYIDVVKVILSKPLAPGGQTEITTPFHVKIPNNFSRGGHTGQSYQVTQWYPKPAVYDRKGWHPMPYLEQGEFYSEFGSYDVRITLPKNYVVAATGELQNEEEKQWLQQRGDPPVRQVITPSAEAKKKAQKSFKKVKPVLQDIQSSAELKTLQYKQDHVHDFAWFADKYYGVKYDTVQLASGRVVEAWSFYTHPVEATWKKSIQYIKDAIHFRSNAIAEYPFNVVSIVEAHMGFEGGMEYPTITSISPMTSDKELDVTIEHEIGHNWFYGVLATNEREYPWMDEGINTYYDKRYAAIKYPASDAGPWLSKRIPASWEQWGVDAMAKEKKDQPIATAAPDLTRLNYFLVAYGKTAVWMQQLEKYIGRDQMDSCMRQYYRQWQFRHPYPEDFQRVIEQYAQKDVSAWFASMHQQGPVTTLEGPKRIKPVFLFSFKDYEKTTWMNWTPVPGYNKYDKLMLGVAIHNFNLPSHRFQFIAVPLYATGSKQLNGIGGVSYSWYPDNRFQKVTVGLGGARFSTLSGVDSTATNIFGGFYKVVPSIRVTFKNKSARSSLEKWIEWKTYVIGERGFTYYLKRSEGKFYPSVDPVATRYLNQLTYNITDYRALYPYDLQLQVQQGNGFYRATATGNYFFNYARGGGVQVRAFAAKFGYIGARTSAKERDAEIYQPKLTAVRGEDDYTYSNFFFGRTEFEGFSSQQIMMRDGGLKIRMDQFADPLQRTDNWMLAMNFNSTLPQNLFPAKIPLRLFLDVGTMDEYWRKGSYTSRFLYVGGLQLSLFKDLLNFYAPLIYSKEFGNNLKTLPGENKFFRKLSFSIDIHRFNLRKLSNNQIPF